jgi:hypothetical protein
MSGPWWGKESRGEVPRGFADPLKLVTDATPAISAEVLTRAASFTPDWTRRGADDAGIAMVRLFSILTEPVHTRINRLPEKTFVEYLRAAGIQPLSATPAEAMLEFAVSDSAPQSTLIPEGFQVATPAADGSGELVIFETEDSLFAAPVKLAALFTQEGRLFREHEADGSRTFLPFGNRARPGRALWIALTGNVAPQPSMNFAIIVAEAPGAPPPASAGGSAPLPVPPPPLLSWDVLDGITLQPAEVLRDGTSGLARSGIVQLQLPRQWRQGIPEGIDGPRAFWIRLRFTYGTFAEDPKLTAVGVNAIRAVAARTIREEVLQPLPSLGKVQSQLRLAQVPVIDGTLQIEVDSDDIDSVTGVPWTRVDDLSLSGPEDLVYTLDPQSGIVTFGDGTHGAALPQGFRNVRAVRYQVGGGTKGAAEAEKITSLLSSAPFVTAATNRLPASGGTDPETATAARRRGPQEIRARGRAVALADYELLALRATGAQVRRAHAASGVHPLYPGRLIPGVTGVFIVPPDRGEGAPVADQQSLQAVARYLSENAAPMGAEIVTAAARFHRVRVEASIVLERDVSAGDVVTQLLATINQYLHPIDGGDDDEGWPFGGPLRSQAIERRMLEVEGVRGINRLNLVIDGFRLASCADFATPQHELLWPVTHEIVPDTTGSGATS